MNEHTRIDADNLKAILKSEKKLSKMVIAEFNRIGPLEFREATSIEFENIIIEIIRRLTSTKTPKSGKSFKDNWEANWNQTLAKNISNGDDENCIPSFIPSNGLLRFEERYIVPISPNFQINILSIIRVYLFEKYFKDLEQVYEFGAGTGHNLLHFSEMYPEKQSMGLDWSNSAVNLIKLMAKKMNRRISAMEFDMLEPNFSFDVEKDSGLLTVGALEQLGTDWKPFLHYMLTKKFKVYINIETHFESYDDSKLLGLLAREYIIKRNWLQGYFAELHKLEAAGQIEILESKKILGSTFHDSWSFTVWKLQNNSIF